MKSLIVFCSKEPEASAFWEDESSKLKVDLKHFELSYGRYIVYEFFLDYKNISIDPIAQKATVSVTLGHRVIHEISILITPDEPTVSGMGGEEHTIVLQKEDGQWKIVSDFYNDFLWRMIRNSGDSPDDMLHQIQARPTKTPTCFTAYPFSIESPANESTSSSNIKKVYINGISYDPEWTYAYPFTNLYFQSDNNSQLIFTIEPQNSTDALTSLQASSEWKIKIFSS
ncbi:MAG: hypothetical protein UZ14_CFX002000767 [Chloroflexi bacterium OLB14]|nr:MAG: hypothetical protein UZ14_CFX002000767 [Chloroflexi bacterium OLB14]